MGWLKCQCGNVVNNRVEETEGYLIREQDDDSFQDAVCRDIASFFAADRSGKREEWLRQFFSDFYPLDVEDCELINDIISSHEERLLLCVSECSQCGRLHIQQNKGSNLFVGYNPVEPGYKAILRSQTQPPTEG